jgi:hypothetical protein
MALHALADDLAFEQVEGSEQSCGAVPFVVVGHCAGASFLHRQARLGAIERLNLALLIDRQNDGMVRRIEIKADDVTQLGNKMRVIGQLELTHPMRLQAMSPPDALNRADADPGRLGHRGPRPMGGVRRRPSQGQGHNRSATPGPKGGMRDGRILSHHSPAMPSAPNRSCQRQMTVLAFSIRRMISVVPWPSAVNRTIFARQTCFWGLFRLATTGSNARRSAAFSVV